MSSRRTESNPYSTGGGGTTITKMKERTTSKIDIDIGKAV